MKKSLVVLVAMFTMVVFGSVSMAQTPAKEADKPAAAAPEKPAAPATSHPVLSFAASFQNTGGQLIN